MTKKAKKSLSLSLVFCTLVGCESGIEKARKPKLIKQIIEQSLFNCSTASSSPTLYEDRLRKDLSALLSRNLDFFLKNSISICWDTRLIGKRDANRNREITSIFYPSETPMIALNPNDIQAHLKLSSIWMKKEKVMRLTEPAIEYRYMSGRFPTRMWKTDKASFFKYPELKKPPQKFGSKQH